jgi:prepilin signal peptidase PulO-like enzyme (type II secretory pathway)
MRIFLAVPLGLLAGLLGRIMLAQIQDKKFRSIWRASERVCLATIAVLSIAISVIIAESSFVNPWRTFCVLLMCACLGVIFETDRTERKIYLLPVLCLAVLGSVYQIGFIGEVWTSSIVGLAVGAGFFGLQYLVTRGRGIGLGDVYLGAALGCLFGWSTLLFALLVSYVGGSVITLILLALKRITRRDPVPLGSFLALGSVFVLLAPPAWIWFGFF